MITLKIIADTPKEALQTVSRLVPTAAIKKIVVYKEYHLDYGEVYTINVSYDY